MKSEPGKTWQYYAYCTPSTPASVQYSGRADRACMHRLRLVQGSAGVWSLDEHARERDKKTKMMHLFAAVATVATSTE